jgi:hypothetical protein
MQRERKVGVTRRGARGRRRVLWIGAGVMAVAISVAAMAIYAPPGPPPNRPVGAGLPPSLPRQVPAVSIEPDGNLGARRAEIAAEEARIAALRMARAQLEQEVAALRQQAEERRRDMPGRKNIPENVAAGPTAPTAPATGGGASLAVPVVTPAPAPDPPQRGTRVFVHHRASSSAAGAAAEDIAQTLRAAGFEVPAIRPAPFVPSTPVVRYFHEEDQAAAARLAGRLGRGWAIQDFRAFTPQPPPQTLEVWLPGQ